MAKYNISIDSELKKISFSKDEKHVECDLLGLNVVYNKGKASGIIAYKMYKEDGTSVNMEHYFDECDDCECSSIFETAAEMKNASDRIRISNKIISKMKNIK